MADEILNQDPKWQFENDDDKELGIETIRYHNGGLSKRSKLSDGSTVLVRRLKGFDIDEVQRQLGTDKSIGYQTLMIARCATIEDKKITPEEVRQLWADDYQKLITMASINFPMT